MTSVRATVKGRVYLHPVADDTYDVVFVESGKGTTLHHTVSTLLEAVRFMIKYCGIPEEEAIWVKPGGSAEAEILPEIRTQYFSG
jgi:hypothetical protein